MLDRREPVGWRGSRPGAGVRAINPYVAQFTIVFIQMLTWAIVARSLLSWFPIDQSSSLYQLLYRTTEPIIEPIRRVLPSTGMIDLSPMAAIIFLIIIGQLVSSVAVTS